MESETMTPMDMDRDKYKYEDHWSDGILQFSSMLRYLVDMRQQYNNQGR